MRKGMAQGLARPAYFDRNPVSKNGDYTAFGVAPHAGTVRLSYTVAAGKKAFQESFMLSMYRDLAAAAPNQSAMEGRYTPNGGSLSRWVWTGFNNGALGTEVDREITGLGFLAAGDVVQMLTSDNSGNGTIQFILGYKLTEFDA